MRRNLFIVLFFLLLAVPFFLNAQNAPGLFLPFPDQEQYKISQGYNKPPTHIKKDFYALDFADVDNNPQNIYGNPVAAATDGKISWVNTNIGPKASTYGINVEIKHSNGIYSRYAHLSKIANIKIGQSVSRGEIIGFIGNTGKVDPPRTPQRPYSGTHLHFVMYTDKLLFDHQKDKTSFGKFAYNPEPISGCTSLGEVEGRIVPDALCSTTPPTVVTPPIIAPTPSPQPPPVITPPPRDVPAKLEITTTSLTPATAAVNTPYVSEPITASGGTSPYKWQLYQNSSPLPPGLKINSKNGVGVIEGTPTQSGTYSFLVEVKDSSGGFFGNLFEAVQRTTKILTLVINEAPKPLPDTTKPIVTNFSISPSSAPAGSSFTIKYTASDSGGSGLRRIELWRTTDLNGQFDKNGWIEVGRHSLSNDGPVSNIFSDAPPIGAYWYGVQAVDGNENIGYEAQRVRVFVSSQSTIGNPQPLGNKFTGPWLHPDLRCAPYNLVADSQSNADVIFIASSYSESNCGVYRSSDGGQSWWPATGAKDFELPHSVKKYYLAITAISIAPSNSDLIYVGTSAAGNGSIFKSIDGGKKWTNISGERASWLFDRKISGQIHSIAIDPKDSNTVYIGSSENIAAGPVGKIYRTSKGGADWDDIKSGGVNEYFFITIDPKNSNTVYAYTQHLIGGELGGISYTGTSSSLYKSIDRGNTNTWKSLIVQNSSPTIGGLAIDPFDNNIIYISTGSMEAQFIIPWCLVPGTSCGGPGIKKTTTGGEKWFPFNTQLLTTTVVADSVIPNVEYTSTANPFRIFYSIEGSEWLLLETQSDIQISSLLYPRQLYINSPKRVLYAPTSDGIYIIKLEQVDKKFHEDRVVTPTPPQTLFVKLDASQTSGVAPLNNVSLTATVGGSAQGSINYTFYCNRSDSGINITPGWNEKFDGVTDNPKTAVCNYPNAGAYTAKVIAERGGAPQVEAHVSISVTPPLDVVPAKFEVTTTSLTPSIVTVNTPYSSEPITATGGKLPYKWSLYSESSPLPPGLSINQNGVIEGTPTQSGTYSFLVEAKDSSGGFIGSFFGAGQKTTRIFTLVVNEAKGEPSPVRCPAVWNPVCGEDGKTYSNSCVAGAARVGIKYPGKCGEAPKPPTNQVNVSIDGNLSINRGGMGTKSITANISEWEGKSATFTVQGLPTGASGKFSPPSCDRFCNATLTIITNPTTPLGHYEIDVVATRESMSDSARFTLTIEWQTKPGAPTNLTTTAVSSSQIQLKWIDTAHDETVVRIERTIGMSAMANPDQPLVYNEITQNKISFLDTGLLPQTEYCYRVYVMNDDHQSDYSNVACATTQAGAPPPPAPEPDLVITSLRAPTEAHSGGKDAMINNVSITIENKGTASAGRFRVEFYWSQDPIITVEDVPAISYFIPNGLGPGESRTGKELGYDAVAIPASLSPGTYYLGAIIDDKKETTENGAYKAFFVEGGQVQESNETNNARSADTGPIILKGLPQTPRLISPDNAATLTYGVDGYIIYRWNSATEWNYIERSDGPNCSEATVKFKYSIQTQEYRQSLSRSGLEPGRTYSWRVRASANGVSSDPSECRSFSVTAEELPMAPTNLNARLEGSVVVITWTDNSSNELGFSLARKGGSADYWSDVIPSIGKDSTSVSDNSAKSPGAMYCYKVKARGTSGPSDYSNEVCVTIP
ncbi:MAG: peptidoglycan DD-metalloendopeptidase family protein [Candidatus Portnoybacteria bacterium]|nr:peptidoglycan DD-metalloendopeptidase family protein [Candidatus Portnoybacteria bacterium]